MNEPETGGIHFDSRHGVTVDENSLVTEWREKYHIDKITFKTPEKGLEYIQHWLKTGEHLEGEES